MGHTSRRDIVFLGLAGFFVANALLAELTATKLITVGPFLLTVGVIQWPAVFLMTDMVNEYYGRAAVRRLTLMTVALILYAFAVVYIAVGIPAAPQSSVSDEVFRAVFGQSLWIMAGSVLAFATSQLVDVGVFWLLRERTGSRMLWLRATGSTVISQLIDSFVVLGIAFWLPGALGMGPAWTVPDFLRLAGANYGYKLLVAIALTPVLYAIHAFIDRYLGRTEAEALVTHAAVESTRH
jgi:queuosine precursor transporter